MRNIPDRDEFLASRQVGWHPSEEIQFDWDADPMGVAYTRLSDRCRPFPAVLDIQ